MKPHPYESTTPEEKRVVSDAQAIHSKNIVERSTRAHSSKDGIEVVPLKPGFSLSVRCIPGGLSST